MHGDSKPRPNKPRGITEEGYAAQNPWHDRAKDKPVFSLGEPLPHSPTVDDGQHQGPSSDSEKPKYPNFSLGEPLPHKVRKHGQHSPAADDVEQGLSQKPTQNDDNEVEKPADKGHNTPDTEATITQHPTRNEHPHDDEQGTEMAHRFQVDADRIGGRREDDAVEDGQVDPNAMRNKWARIRAKYPEPLAEFLCTAMSVFLGLTGTLSVNLSQGQTETGEYGTYETLCWAWGFAFMFGIYLGGGVSGAHMNPAISVSLSLFRGFPWRRCAVYVAVQILAAFAGGALAYGLYYDAIQNVDPTLTQTYTSFITVPKPVSLLVFSPSFWPPVLEADANPVEQWVTPATAFFSEFLGGAVISKSTNQPVAKM